ncbi:adenosylcobinamide amidohydrolase [Natronococcus amylolyticus DSM 10524]|uniref:Adenosylcobinamide amidohydrolase n=1 Tax=Natronococcus amylolyticus DSM 10524 TaxID=1227497 RepID=L9X506_9EURY|nr:adenosylcobinamide amidohydrolase [Natronococcus amylolyticus DSM 10524]
MSAVSDGPHLESRRRDGVLRLARPETEWLSTGWNGGRQRAACAYNVSVPEGWGRTDLEAYADERLERAGFEDPGPVLFTGVDVADARGAHCGPVTAYATAGISNPAALPMEPSGGSLESSSAGDSDSGSPTGTVNVVVYADRRLADGALANLLAVAAEAKAATLLAETGFPGTTTDAIIVGHDPGGEPAAFSGSATTVGASTRACVRDAVRASLRAHYRPDSDVECPDSLEDAAYGVSTDVRAQVLEPGLGVADGEPEG